jgi:general secretion pathway protein G
MARGYTIVELLIVMMILGVLAAMTLPLAEVTVRRDKERELKRALWEIRDAIDAYRRAGDAGLVAHEPGRPAYPATLRVLVEGAVGSSSTGAPLHFLRRLPRDPFADPALPAEATWGLRSFESSAADPRPGANVYDVYSLANGTGLNGIPLRQW